MSADLAAELSRQTEELVSRFEQRASGFRGRGDLARLTVTADRGAAEAEARAFFGEGEHQATGIDGSMDFDERLQMILFYANATAYSCPFRVGERVSFDLASAGRDERLAASAAVPLWSEDLASVLSRDAEMEMELEHSLERIPNAFMTLGEIYLALQACSRSRLVFLDRPLSGTYSTLSRDARNMLKLGRSSLLEWGGGSGATQLDLELAVGLGAPGLAVPTRARYLHMAVAKALLAGPLTYAELSAALGVGEGEVRRAGARLQRYDRRHEGRLLGECGEERLQLAEGASGYWERASGLALRYARDVFAERKHPLSLGGERYITILDVSAAALILLGSLCQEALAKRVLLLGITKDTTATDVTRAVLPYAARSGAVSLESDPPRLRNDRAFLSILSSENPSVRTPWRTLGYDACLSTVVFMGEGFRSARKVVSREQLFVRSYFQLRTLKSDPGVRSQVFLFDRLYDQAADSGSLASLQVEERVGATRLAPYFESAASGLSNLALHILSLNDNPEVFEAYGHNQLLYLADKAVKAEVRLLRSSLRGVADLRVGGVSRRRKVFGLVTPYRQQRAEAEHARGRA